MLGPNAQIAEGIQDLETLNGKLSRLAKKIGTRQDTAGFQRTLDQERKNAKKLCQDIMALIQQSVQQSTSSGSRRVLTKLSKQFEEQLGRFRDIETQMSQKRSASLSDRTPLLGDSAARDAEEGQSQAQIMAPQQQVDIQFLEYDLEEIEQRHQAIQQIEMDIQEIGEMFKDLHALVQEQGESLNVIETDIVSAKDETIGAHEELLKAESYQKKARKKKCCLLFIVLAALGALVLIITYAT